MLSTEENELLTRVGAGTPMGQLMRRYWMPALPSDHISAPGSPPVRVQLLGENLVAFRDSEGCVGLLDEKCPHRTASLYFGRNEECGLRCVYHGWKFNIHGDCVDLPSEPPGSTLQRKVRVRSYPCLERGGLVWTYMGPLDLMPEFPDLEWTRLPPSQRYQSRQIMECNWLQGIEGGFDSSHLSFLHGGVAEGDITIRPWRYEVVSTKFGFIAGSGRPLDEERTFWTANIMVMPFHKIIASAPVAAHAWVPMDDEHTMQYCVTFSPHRPFTDSDLARETRFDGIHAELIPGTDRPMRNRGNDYLIDRKWQASGESYTGIKGLGTQDNGIQESMGFIADRTVEHLGVTDTAIIQLRRFLLSAVRDHCSGDEPPGLDPSMLQIRSSRFYARSTDGFADVMASHIRLDAPAAMS